MKKNNYSLNILVIDDEEGMCKATERVLQKFNLFFEDLNSNVDFKISSCLSGKDFLNIHFDNPYHIYLVDYKLPDINGIQIIEKLKLKYKDALIIMITAYATLETAVGATKMGAFDFIAKPFSPEEIRHAIKKATYHYLLSLKAKNLESEKKKVRFQFISVLAHELKSPLNAVEGYVDILEDNEKLNHEDYKNILNRLKIRINGMRKLIFDLLDLTRIESGEKLRNLASNNLNEIILNSIDLLKLEADKRNIKINFNQSPMLYLNSDKAELEIVFNNLISNSIKYNKENGEVIICLSETESKIIFEVKDTGIGMDENDMKNLFNDFYRIKNQSTINITGSGLGLSTVKKILNLYNASIDIQSKLNEGSKFLITFNK